MSDPWSLYWQADRLDSADAVKSGADADAIRNCWRDFAAGLEAGAHVLDLATGNGTVPRALLQADASLQLCGVDRADIDPARFLQSPGVLQAVDFRAGIDIGELPFDDASFDAVTSQFGIEYAPLDDAIGEAVRVLKPDGLVQFLLHRNDSEVVQPAADRRTEMQALLADDGVLDALRDVIAGQATEDDLEKVGMHYRESTERQTQGITGQIFSGVSQAIRFLQAGDRRAAAELCETMRLRLAADRDRLLALEAAALDENGFTSLLETLDTAGIEPEFADVLLANDDGSEFVIGWLYRGRKR